MNLKVLLNQFDITTVYVTHDQQEAMLLADQLVIMNDGRVVQRGTVDDLYRHPNHRFVAEFLNLNTETPAINILAGDIARAAHIDGADTIGVRPEHVALAEAGAGAVQGTLRELFPMPLKNITIARIAVGDDDVYAALPGTVRRQLPMPVGLDFEQWTAFAADGAAIATVTLDQPGPRAPE